MFPRRAAGPPMSLARIITRSPENSGPLQDALLARGFTVETVSPDDTPSEAADLEIRLEECSAAEVLRKASEIPESQDMTVFIAPDTITESSRFPRVVSPHPVQATRPLEIEAVEAESAVQVPPAQLPEVVAEVLKREETEECAVEAAPVEMVPSETAIEPVVAEVETSPQEEVCETLEATSAEVNDSTPLQAQPEAPELRDLLAELESVMTTMETQAEPGTQNEAEEGTTAPAPVSSEALPEPESLVAYSAPPSDWPIWTPPVTTDALPAPASDLQVTSASRKSPPPRRLSQAFAYSRGAVAQLRSRTVLVVGGVRKRIAGDERYFWGAAVAVGVVAVSALLLGAAFHRISPLPKQLSTGQGLVESFPVPVVKPEPASGANTATPQSIGASPNLLKPASIRKPETVANDADLIAPDTVIRYVNRERVSKPLKQQTLTRHRRNVDIIAEDTITHYDHSTGAAAPAQKTPR